MMAVEKTEHLRRQDDGLRLARLRRRDLLRGDHALHFNLPTNWGHELMVLPLRHVLRHGRGRSPLLARPCPGRRDLRHVCRAGPRPFMDICHVVFFYLFVGVRVHLELGTFTGAPRRWTPEPTSWGIEIPGEASFTDWGPAYYPMKFLMPFGGVPLLLSRASSGLIRDVHLAFTGREFK